MERDSLSAKVKKANASIVEEASFVPSATIGGVVQDDPRKPSPLKKALADAVKAQEEAESDIDDTLLMTEAEAQSSSLQAMSLLSNESSRDFYREACGKVNVKPNNTFLKALMGERSLINFANSYFGDRGMASIAPTLARIPVISLDLQNTGLTFEDTGLLVSNLLTHPTLTSIDLRNMAVSVPSARRWLSLAIQNRRITTIQLDENAPKNILIQRQCFSNANVCVYASACVMCGLSMIHMDQQSVEAHTILRLIDRLGLHLPAVTSIEFEAIFKGLIGATDLNDGILFVCSTDCVEALADDLVGAAYFVQDSVEPIKKNVPHPKNILLSRIAEEIVKEYAKAAEQQEKRNQRVNFNSNKPEDAAPAAAVPEWPVCTLCGEAAVSKLDNPRTVYLQLFAKDLDRPGAYLRPSAFVRLINTMLERASGAVCSVKCARALVRHCILGSGGANLSRPLAEIGRASCRERV